MFYKHTHLLFLSLSFVFQFPNSQVQQTNTKSTTMSSTTSPLILPISNTTATTTAQSSQPPIASPAFRNLLNNITKSVRNNLAQRRPWSELVNPGHVTQASATQAMVRVYFFFFFLGLGFRFDQFLFWILFLGFLGLWKFKKGEWEKKWTRGRWGKNDFFPFVCFVEE